MRGWSGMASDKKETKYQIIKNSLVIQLEERGVIAAYAFDLIDDYMKLWGFKNKCVTDINQRGVSVRYQNGENQFGYKKNDSIDQLLKINGQMIKILDTLEIKLDEELVEDDEDF